MSEIRGKTNSEIKEWIQHSNVSSVQIGLTDLNGVMRGKTMAVPKFIAALDSGLGFCDVVVGTDIDDQLCDGMRFTGWHSGYPDAPIEVVQDSARMVPWADNQPFFLTQFAPSHSQLCPRSILAHVCARAKERGFTAFGSLEFEFSVFADSIHQLHDSNFQSLHTITPANCGYSVLRSSTYDEFHQGLWDLCQTMDMPLEGLHTEIGPGVLEAALCYDQALEAADRAALFKTFAKIFAQRNDCVATFMAKWNIQHQGQSGHTHLSLRNEQGDTVFYDASAPHNMSALMRSFVAGQQRYMPELLAMVAPNINSYARLVPGFWAPTQASWGVDNRTCALRVINSSASSQRVEYRAPGADTNPYLAIAVALASGLAGIDQGLELDDPIQGNAYEINLDDRFQLPRNLQQASERLLGSTMARDYFGDQFVEDYAATRVFEVKEASRQVTDWQLKRYFELA